MATNILKIGLLITATQLLLSGSCNRDGSKPCTLLTPYSFSVTSEFSPQKEVYNLGDTIYLTSTFPKNLTNSITSQQVDYNNSLGISGNFNTISLDTVKHTINEGLNNFFIFSIKGSNSPIANSPNLGVNILYIENTSSYEIKLGLKILKKGIFYIGITDLSSQGIKGQDCTNAGFSMTVTNTNKNLNLFQYALGYPADAMLAKNIYCFRVQ